MVVMLGCAIALLLLVLAAKREARRKDERYGDPLASGRQMQVASVDRVQRCPDADRSVRAYVTVEELIERERDATRPIPIAMRRPRPYSRCPR